LESMTGAPRPTRAEAGDVANAILDGADAVMLSGETAGGAFPVEAVTIMRKLCEEAEKSLDYMTIYNDMRSAVLARDTRMNAVEAMTSTVVKTAQDAGAPLIICFTESGSTVRFVAKYRPRATILAVTTCEEVARSLNTLRGTISLITSLEGESDAIAKTAIEYARRVGCDGVVSGAPVVLVTEEREGQRGAGVSAKVIKLLTVP